MGGSTRRKRKLWGVGHVVGALRFAHTTRYLFKPINGAHRMTSLLTNTMAVGAFCISLIALFISYRKDGHHIRLEVTPQEPATPHEMDVIVLGINNDSACSANILSVGHFNSLGHVTWIKRVGDCRTNKFVTYPFSVSGRSIFAVLLIRGRDVPYKRVTHGYCVQLATGRIYVLRGNVPLLTALKMHCASWLSRVSRGRFTLPGLSRPRLPH